MKIYVAGHRGLVGSAIVRAIEAGGGLVFALWAAANVEKCFHGVLSKGKRVALRKNPTPL